MIDIFAREHVDRTLLPDLWLKHRDGPGLVLQVGENGPPALMTDGGQPSAAAVVTTLLRLAAVGDFVIRAEAQGSSLAHLSHVLRRAELADRDVVADLERVQLHRETQA